MVMKKESLNKIKLGIFITIGILILLTGIYLVGQNKKLFSTTIRISALFKDVSGLQAGNNVRFAGITVGSVDGIYIISDSTVKVDMIIDIGSKKFIKKDSKAIIGTDGLMGNKIVNISSGSYGISEIQNNDMIGTTLPVNYDEILLSLKTTTDNAALITKDLSVIVNSISTGKGIIGKILIDESLAKNIDNSVNNLAILTNDLSTITTGISTGKGTLGRFLVDTSVANNMNQIVINFEKSSKGLVKLIEKARGSWLLGGIFGSNPYKEDTVDLKLKKEAERIELERLKQEKIQKEKETEKK